jgi:hypothetical protein
MNIASYISGYVDGEGCFTISFSPRKKMRGGWEVRPSFSVSQNADRSGVLKLMQGYFQCGSIRPDRSDKTLKYEVRSIDDLVSKVLPHFAQYPLLSEKQREVERFAKVCELVHQRKHLTQEGIREIVTLAMQMNPSGRRQFTEGDILMRSGLGLGEHPKVIVSASSNGGST